ncbi:hypothetical protein AVEN_215649-1 [Araneus ventricosus]|uniref:Uncharacterized protein n=1 Tax=Araneus ventricosus TaxID=182803 RepID=A0A4Y2G7B7_ARAVE|nr:hypothetical protein AVEN_215649-1 [Araneus ventricosus]
MCRIPETNSAHKNRNNNFDSNKYLVNSNNSYAQKANGTSANTLDSEQQMASPAHRPANNVNNQSAAFASTCIESNVNNCTPPGVAIMIVQEGTPLKHLLYRRDLKSLHQAPQLDSAQTLQIPLISL